MYKKIWIFTKWLLSLLCQQNLTLWIDKRRPKKTKLKRDLNFYLDYYKEVTARSERIKEEFDIEIERIVEALKKMGK